jgi:hypothetical protein
MAEPLDPVVNKNFWSLFFSVALILLIINAIFDAINVFTGNNLKKYWNKPVSALTQATGSTTSTNSTTSGS